MNLHSSYPSGSPLAAVLRQRLDSPPDRAGLAGAALERRLRERLTVLRAVGETDPFGNPLLLAALELSRSIDAGDVVTGTLTALVQRLSVRCFADCADRLVRYMGDLDLQANDQRLAALIEGLIGPEPIAFEAFRRLVERPVFGIVLTGHPTFGRPVALARILAAITTGRDAAGVPLGARASDAALHEALTAEHLPPEPLTLPVEHDWSLEALGHVQAALDRVNATVLDVAARHYPARWAELVPCLATAASWVGYDLDGRADITWTDTIAKRLGVKLHQLRRHAAVLGGLLPREAVVRALLEPAAARMAQAIGAVQRQLAAVEAVADKPSRAGELVEVFLETRGAGMVDTVELRGLVENAIAAAEAPALRRDLAVLRAALGAHGLGLAHTHVRLNSTQLHNAIRKQVGMEGAPNDPGHRRSYMNAINDLLSRVAPETVNFAVLMAENATAKRLFMIVQQMLKYIDAETPIRFLIAETEAGFTLLTALYFARLFGVADRIEISPLFETAEAMEHGDQIVDDALKSPHYRAYVQSVGRLAIQFGFSDSGRYLGQMAATFQMERLRLRLPSVMARHGLENVQLVLFNTHGESIGRGGHPDSLADRMRYVSPPVTRAAFAAAGIAVKEEVSFQGGDGFQLLMGLPSAYAVLQAGIGSMLVPDPEAAEDPVYAMGDYAVEFFATVRQAFEGLVADPNYAALLGVFGTNLAPRAGSRPTRRQHEGSARAMDLAHVSQLRAIPNNTILQQLGMLANTLYGLGRARAKDPELFADLLQHSPRFRRAMAMAEAALGVSDLDVLKAYIDGFDPGTWLARSGRARRLGRADELRLVAAELEKLELHPPLVKVFRRFQADLLGLTQSDQETGGGLAGRIEPARRDTLLLLHVVRLALIHRLYLLAVHVPEFSAHHGLSRSELIARLLRLDVPGAVAVLKSVYPKGDPAPLPAAALAEPATYRGDAGQSYAREHATLFDPMLDLYRMILTLGAALGTTIGAVG